MKFIPLLVAAAIAAPASAVTFDPYLDFSIAGNPNGAYSYGYQSVLGGSLTLFTTSGPANAYLESWTAPTVDQFLGVYNTNTTLLQHPGLSGQYSILRVTLSLSGIYNVDGTFSNGDNATTDVHVLGNGVSLFGGGVTNATSSTFNFTHFFAAGSTIDFAVGNGGNGYLFDSTLLRASISAVPEPQAWALMVGGFAVVGFSLRHKRFGAVPA